MWCSAKALRQSHGPFAATDEGSLAREPGPQSAVIEAAIVVLQQDLGDYAVKSLAQQAKVLFDTGGSAHKSENVHILRTLTTTWRHSYDL